MIITEAWAQAFATEWLSAWNSQNIERVLAHYTDDFELETPIAARVVPESAGKLRGKDAVRAYWTKALAGIPDLHFDLLDLLTGVDGLTIYYINTATGRKSAEVLFVNEAGLVHKSAVHYS